jgi:hypothetical protein
MTDPNLQKDLTLLPSLQAVRLSYPLFTNRLAKIKFKFIYHISISSVNCKRVLNITTTNSWNKVMDIYNPYKLLLFKTFEMPDFEIIGNFFVLGSTVRITHFIFVPYKSGELVKLVNTYTDYLKVTRV